MIDVKDFFFVEHKVADGQVLWIMDCENVSFRAWLRRKKTITTYLHDELPIGPKTK